MPRLRRPQYTKLIPPGSEIITKKGKPHARFKDRKGRAVVAPLTGDGKRVRLTSKKFYGEYTDADGSQKCVPLSTDEVAAGQLLAGLVEKAERKRAKLGDPFEAHHKRPLAEHLEDYRRHLQAEGNSPAYIAKRCSRVREVLSGCGFAFVTDFG